MKSLKIVAIAAASLLANSAFAAAVVTDTTQFDLGFTVSNTDLLQTSLASSVFTGEFSHEGSTGAAALNNGIYGAQGNQGSFGNGTEAATASSGSVATFTFSGAGGYNITSVDSYAGWDDYRGGQSYDLSYATAADPSNFIYLASVYNDAQAGGNTNTHANILGSSGYLASNVQSLRFEFKGDLTYGYAGYREIDVQGVAAAVPEPQSYALMLAGLGAIGFVARRRKLAQQ
ncbi:PEP-CTERM sorting domain-containing protein [Paucibacter sp. B2R-40]|uniref:PEP-CTERM sorting domain-containing protein n=1 Tax=Paucibacter sp. B2R-40 TaxID=2893554 RepID=UPI0021E49B18|nr:PEP-CTERM sorting domain-containing protein [Paucibacter sp. B2R-40]MCV2356947.1 PEP-CTERM sorting domain-containing protein [Paucibacter sp. B2R-40]